MAESWAAVLATPMPGGPRLGLATAPAGLSQVRFLPPQTPLQPARDSVAAYFADRLESYFGGEAVAFDGPLAPADTAYRDTVRSLMQAIPAGAVRSYGQLAREIGSAPRAVAGACRANPLPLVVPCHRVVGSAGVGGYMGRTAGPPLEYKRWLLRHEGGS